MRERRKIQVITSEQKQPRCRLQRWLSVLLVFILVASVKAQSTPTNAPTATSTNQSAQQAIPTNTAPSEPVVLPAYVPPLAEQESAANLLTNQFGVMPVAPPQVGPAAVGSPQPLAPIMGTSALARAPGPILQQPAGPGIPLWGPVDIHPHLLYTFLYGNGLEAVPGQSSITTINTVAPGFLVDIGPQWSIDYTPSLSYYSNKAFKNTTDENVILRGNWARNDWVFGLTQSYSQTTEPLIETGTQTSETAYATGFNAVYQIGSKTSLQLGVNQNFRDTSGGGELSDLEEWLTQDWLNYQAGEMFGVGLGASAGYDNLIPGSGMPFEQVLGRVDFHPGSKISLSITGGGEDRQFVNPSAPPLITPIFNGQVTYSNYLTTVTLVCSRSVTPSLFQNDVETITSYSATLRQELSRKFSIQGNAGYIQIPETSIVPGPLPQFYIGAPTVTPLSRISNDDVTSLGISLSYALVPDHAILSVLYNWRNNSSGQAAFSYLSHQVGFTFNYTY